MMRIRSKSRLSPRASKRKNETEPSSTAASEPKPKRKTKKKDSEQKESSSLITRGSTVLSSVMVDKYCWLCHTETNDKICVTCHRAFHNGCLGKKTGLFSELGVCPECQCKSVDGTELKSSKYFNSDKLKRMLDVLTRRSFDKKRDKNEIFLRWQEEDRDKLFKIIDLEILLDNINNVRPYRKTAEFYSDVKFIHHNASIVYGVNSDQAKAAKNLREKFKTELLFLEACPECYYHHLYSGSHDPFVRLCDSPHDIVWAQFGSSYWPAKCLKVVNSSNPKAHVRFFGKHEQSNIPIKKCFHLSKSYPTNENSNLRNSENVGLKSPGFKSARAELLRYIRLYEQEYGDFPFCPHRTHYKPQEKQKVIIISAEGSSNRNMAQIKLEGIVNEDSEANVINEATLMEFSEDTLTFPNSVTNVITSSNGFVLDSFKEFSLKSLHPEGNENLVGQFSTLDELQPSIDVDSTRLNTIPVESGLNSNPSPVTSINMSFSSEENPSIIDVPMNPVVASIKSLQSTESPPIPLSSAGDTSLDCDFRLLENFKGILHPEPSKVTETSQRTEILSTTVGNNASDDSPIQPDSLRNIMNSFSVFTESQDELDNEVLYIGQKNNKEDELINPDIILSLLEENSPELKLINQKARYWINGMLLQLWASCSKNTGTLGSMSKTYVQLRKCRSDLKKMEEENDKMKKEEAENKFQIQSLTDKLKNLESENSVLQTRIDSVLAKSNEARQNAKLIIASLKTGCSKQIEGTLKQQHRETMEKKEKELEAAEATKKSLTEEKRRLEKELQEAKVAKQSAEEKLRVAKSQKCAYDRDDIVRFKKTHYCTVCESSAAFVCCLNTSYCSTTCQKDDAEEHRPHCKREIPSQRTVQTTVCRKLLVCNLQESSTISNSSYSQEIFDTNSVAGSTRHKNAETSASPVLPTPPDSVMVSSSHSCTSKSKRRYHK